MEGDPTWGYDTGQHLGRARQAYTEQEVDFKGKMN
jgi:hypothetical protein